MQPGDYGSGGRTGSGGSGAASGTRRSREGVGASQGRTSDRSFGASEKDAAASRKAWGGAGPEQSFLGGSRSCYMQPGTFGGGAGVRSGRSGSLSSGGTSSGGNTTGSYGGYGAGGATNRNASTGSKAWGGSGPERSFLGGTRSCYMLPGTPGGGVSAGNRKNDNVGDGGESGGASSSGASGRGAKAKRGSTGRKGGAGSQQSFDSGARSVYFGPR
ncbi:hypothetical protein Tcan_04276 [Toxocara canis]|uniref:Uncharacterized protein n=1 Tax=Toxocara canis TaxID=6265 RepID=A0A0B2VTT2_TOXCA|nr:hypothetical protein Tcan_04276 [Toxocara canis]